MAGIAWRNALTEQQTLRARWKAVWVRGSLAGDGAQSFRDRFLEVTVRRQNCGQATRGNLWGVLNKAACLI